MATMVIKQLCAETGAAVAVKKIEYHNALFTTLNLVFTPLSSVIITWKVCLVFPSEGRELASTKKKDTS